MFVKFYSPLYEKCTPWNGNGNSSNLIKDMTLQMSSELTAASRRIEPPIVYQVGVYQNSV